MKANNTLFHFWWKGSTKVGSTQCYYCSFSRSLFSLKCLNPQSFTVPTPSTGVMSAMLALSRPMWTADSPNDLLKVNGLQFSVFESLKLPIQDEKVKLK